MAEQATTEPEIRKGLAGVPVDYTAISKVDPESNSLLYRGYPPVQDLAKAVTFEEVAYLLWHGELPDDRQLADFEQFERAHRALDHVVKKVIDELPLTVHPMDVIRTAASVIAHATPRSRMTRPKPNSARPSASSRRSRLSSRTTSAAGAGSSSSSRATTSATRRTSSS